MIVKCFVNIYMVLGNCKIIKSLHPNVKDSIALEALKLLKAITKFSMFIYINDV